MKNYTFADVNVHLPEQLAAMSLEAGATCFVHVSALAADPHALSAWARSKAAGEAAVRAACPGAVIVRPSDVFGTEDRLLNLFAKLHGAFPRVPLVAGGTARVQPLYVHDLAAAIHAICTSEDPHVMLGQTYDLAGPDEYTLREVRRELPTVGAGGGLHWLTTTPAPLMRNVSPPFPLAACRVRL